MVVGAQQFVVGVEAGVSLGEDGLTLGPLAKGAKGRPLSHPCCCQLACNAITELYDGQIIAINVDERRRAMMPDATGSAAAEAALAGVAGTCKRTQQVQVFTAARHGLLVDVAVKVSVLSRDDELIEQVKHMCNSSIECTTGIVHCCIEPVHPPHSTTGMEPELHVERSAHNLCLQPVFRCTAQRWRHTLNECWTALQRRLQSCRSFTLPSNITCEHLCYTVPSLLKVTEPCA